jgi:hypothetical protein
MRLTLLSPLIFLRHSAISSFDSSSAVTQPGRSHRWQARHRCTDIYGHAAPFTASSSNGRSRHLCGNALRHIDARAQALRAHHARVRCYIAATLAAEDTSLSSLRTAAGGTVNWARVREIAGLCDSAFAAALRPPIPPQPHRSFALRRRNSYPFHRAVYGDTRGAALEANGHFVFLVFFWRLVYTPIFQERDSATSSSSVCLRTHTHYQKWRRGSARGRLAPMRKS